MAQRMDDIRFMAGKNTFEVAPNFALRAMQELHVEFDAKAPADRIDASQIGAASNVSHADETGA